MKSSLRLLLLMGLVITSCGEGETPEAEEGSSTAIGPDGGTVTGPNGVTIEVPPGALDSEVGIGVSLASSADLEGLTWTELPSTVDTEANTVSVEVTSFSFFQPGAADEEEDDGVAEVGDGYEITPHGQVFQEPVTVTIPYEESLIPSATAEESVAVFRGSQCIPDCTGLECGDDGCGGTCGTCGGAEVCRPSGHCSEANREGVSTEASCNALDFALLESGGNFPTNVEALIAPCAVYNPTQFADCLLLAVAPPVGACDGYCWPSVGLEATGADVFFDDEGRIVSSGWVEDIVYDAQGRAVQVDLLGRGVKDLEYDAAGRLTGYFAAVFEYDAQDRLSSYCFPEEDTGTDAWYCFWVEYDPAGRPVRVIDGWDVWEECHAVDCVLVTENLRTDTYNYEPVPCP